MFMFMMFKCPRFIASRLWLHLFVIWFSLFPGYWGGYRSPLFGCAWMSGQWVIKQGIWGWNKNRNLLPFYCLSLVVQQPTARGAQIIGIMHIMIMCIKLQLKYIFVLIKSFTSISIYEDTAYNHIIIYA